MTLDGHTGECVYVVYVILEMRQIVDVVVVGRDSSQMWEEEINVLASATRNMKNRNLQGQLTDPFFG